LDVERGIGVPAKPQRTAFRHPDLQWIVDRRRLHNAIEG
jgi:hypothetical protein